MLLSFGTLFGCGGSSDDGEGLFLLLTIDTLRADRLGTYGQPRGLTPRIDRLAARSIVFSNCSSVSSWTMPAMGTLATGLRPNEHGMVYWHLPLADVPTTVAEALEEGGVTTAFFGNPIPALPGIDRGFDTWKAFEGDDAAAVDATVEWLRDHRRGRRFLWVHLLTPHAPYDPLPGTIRLDSALDPRTELYDAEVLTTDLLVGELLKAVGDHAAVAVTADHGETLDERGNFAYDHGKFLWEELLRVPCLLRVPGGTPRIDPRPVGLADVPRTICEWFGVDAPEGSYGASLLDPGSGESQRRQPTFASVVGDEPPRNSDERWAVRMGRHKAEFNVNRETVRFYDLQLDPRETEDLAETKPAEIERMRAPLEEWRRLAPTPDIPFERRFSPEELQRLQSLGYLGGGR